MSNFFVIAMRCKIHPADRLGYQQHHHSHKLYQPPHTDNHSYAGRPADRFGTLFERGLDPGKRSQLGAHYTGEDDILLIVEPVLMKPLRDEWGSIKDEVRRLKDEESKERGKGGAEEDK